MGDEAQEQEVDTEAAVETETLAEDVVEAGTEGEEIASEEAGEESEQAATDDDPEVEATPAPKAKKAGKAKKPPEPEDPKAKLARLKADPEVQRLIKAEADKRAREELAKQAEKESKRREREAMEITQRLEAEKADLQAEVDGLTARTSALETELAFYRTGMETGVRLRDPSDSEYLQTLVVRHVNEGLDYQAAIVQVRNDKPYLFVIPDNEIATEEDDDEVEAEEAQPAKKPVVKPKPAVVPVKKPAVAARPVPVPVVKPRPSTTTPVKATTTTPEPKPAVDPLKMSNADFEAHMNALVAKAQAGAATH
jgi:hypothetical protein